MYQFSSRSEPISQSYDPSKFPSFSLRKTHAKIRIFRKFIFRLYRRIFGFSLQFRLDLGGILPRESKISRNFHKIRPKRFRQSCIFRLFIRIFYYEISVKKFYFWTKEENEKINSEKTKFPSRKWSKKINKKWIKLRIFGPTGGVSFWPLPYQMAFRGFMPA